MSKFSGDVADVPIFFEGVEKLFASFSVLTELQTRLLLPYLNERAISLLLRLERSEQKNYDNVKKCLFHEFKSTPVQYEDRFDRAVRGSDETYTIFCSRLKNLLTF